MCGIIAVLSRRDGRTPPTAAELSTLLATAHDSVATDPAGAAGALTAVDKVLRGVPGVIALTNEAQLIDSIIAALADIEGKVAELEAEVESGTRDDDAAVIALRDASWAIGRDRIRTAQEVHALAAGASEDSFNGYLSIQRALSALDRLEVRGRDSAGIHVMVSDHGLAVEDPFVAQQLSERSNDALFRSRSVRWVDTTSGPVLSFVYKAAAEIGELGDNTAAIRQAVRNDGLLRAVLSSPTAVTAVLGHTRWASIGVLSLIHI